MKKEMIICIIIIALIIITNIIAQRYTRICVESMTGKLYELEEDVIKIENANSGAKSQDNDMNDSEYTSVSKNDKTSNRKNDENNSNNQIYSKIYNIDKSWHEFHNQLAFYIEHDELEKVETRISNLKGLEKSQKYEEMLPQIEECVFLLEHIRDKHILTAINIF